jgi:hypothetical protein
MVKRVEGRAASCADTVPEILGSEGPDKSDLNHQPRYGNEL